MQYIAGNDERYALLWPSTETLNTQIGVDVADKYHCCRKRPTYNQLIVCAILLCLLLVAAAVMSTLFAMHYNKTGCNTGEMAAGKSTNFTAEYNKTVPNNTSEVCRSADCIVAAGNMISWMDPSTDPCEDFYQYACGGYFRQHSIPANTSKQDVIEAIDTFVKKDLRAVLERKSAKEETETDSKVKCYYNSCMNRDLINKKSVEHLNKLVNDLGGLYLSNVLTKNLSETWTIDDLLKKRNKYSQSGLFSFSVSPDGKNASRNILTIRKGGLSLSRYDYLGTTVENDPDLQAYSKMLSTFSKLIVGVDNVNDSYVMDVVRFEQKLAGIQQFSLFDRNADIKWLQRNAGFIQWLQFFNSAFSNGNYKMSSDEPVVLSDLDYLKKLLPLLKRQLSTEAGRKTVQNYVVLLAINDYAPKLGDKFIAAADEFHSAYGGLDVFQKGVSRDKHELWETCLDDTDSKMGFLLGSQYVKSFFRKDARDKALSIIELITDTFRHRLEKNLWMNESTRKKALEKLSLLRHNVGFPDWIVDDAYLSKLYPNLSVSNDYIENLFVSYRSNLITMARHLKNKTVDPERWDVKPQTVAAYYEIKKNRFVVPAGLIRPVIFFQGEGIPDLLNFAGLGAVGGHEITHGFDDMGAEYDKDGSLCLIDQYNDYPGNTFWKYSQGIKLNVNGNRTLLENIADNGGFRTSFQAYKAAQQAGKLNIPTLVGLENLNPDQLFFLGNAQTWCGIYTTEGLNDQLKYDIHSPDPFRVIGPLSNSPDFAKAFKCMPGSNMNPVKKCEVF